MRSRPGERTNRCPMRQRLLSRTASAGIHSKMALSWDARGAGAGYSAPLGTLAPHGWSRPGGVVPGCRQA